MGAQMTKDQQLADSDPSPANAKRSRSESSVMSNELGPTESNASAIPSTTTKPTANSSGTMKNTPIATNSVASTKSTVAAASLGASARSERGSLSSDSSSSAQEQKPSPSKRARKEQDLSYLERPRIRFQHHPPQPPSDSRFARPSTRRNGPPHIGHHDLLERERKRRRDSKKSGARASSSKKDRHSGSEVGDISPSKSLDAVQSQNQKEEQIQQEETGNTEASTAKDTVSVEETVHKEPTNVHEQTSTSSTKDTVAKSSPSSNISEFVQEKIALNTNKHTDSSNNHNVAVTALPTTRIESVIEVPAAPATATIDESSKNTADLNTETASPLSVQVTSVMQASPSRRVVFSPDKQESRLSTPNSANIPKLKGILKSSVTPVGKLDMSKMVMPTEEEIANNRPIVKRKPKLVQKTISSRMFEARFSGNKSRTLDNPFTDTSFISSSGNSALTSAASPAKVLDPFIRESIEKLKSDDLAVRKETYDSMLNILRNSKDKTFYDEIQESIRPLTARILIDLDHGDTETVVTLSVHRCLAFLFFEKPIAQLFTAQEVDRLLKLVLRVTDISDNKTLVNVSLCCLGTCMVPMKILAPYCEQIIQSISNHLNSRLNSTSATNEGILNLIAFLMNHPEEIVPTAQIWLSSLLLLLVHEVPGIRKKALESIQALVPTFLQADDNRLRLAAIAFMNDHGDQFVQKLDEEHLKPNHEVFALRIWGTVVTVLGKDLHRHPMLNPMLKIVEIAFNRGPSKNNDAKITAFKAWTRLIYSFSRGGHLQSEKTRKLIFRPIAKGLAPINNNRARLAAANSWMALLYGLGPELVKNADEVFFPIVRPLITDESEHIRDLILRLLTAMFSNAGGAGLKATVEAERAVSGLLYFIDRVSKSNPSTLVPGDWPDREHGDVKKLLADPEKAGYIIRADIVHYLYTGMVEVMTSKALVATRYKVQDTIHADIFDALMQDSTNTQPRSMETRAAEPRDITISPMEFILKCWLALGESVQNTHFEASFWQATSTLVDWSANSLQILRALYRCIGHLDDIKAKRQTNSIVIWPPESHGPVSPLAFRDFEIKYWAIVAVRLTSLMNTINEISEDHSSSTHSEYEDLFAVLLYPLSTLRSPRNDKSDGIHDDHSQRKLEGQSKAALKQEYQFLEKRTQICLPDATDKHTIVLADPKAAINTSLGRSAYYGLELTKSRPKEYGENMDNILHLCTMLAEQAYRGIQLAEDLADDPATIPTMHESAILLLEKAINKAPTSLVLQWIQNLQKAILLWLTDPGCVITNLPDNTRRAYQNRIATFWNECVLHRLLDYGVESKANRTKSGFGSVLEPPSTTIRGAFERAQMMLGPGSVSGSKSAAGAGLLSRSSSSSSLSSSGKVTGPYSSEDLVCLSPLLVAVLKSRQKTMVNKTLEFWNESFGMSESDLAYPADFVEVIRPLKLVATIKLPGWSLENDSQLEAPQFSASMSQENLLSVPSELNFRVNASKLMKQKAGLNVSSPLSKTSSPKKTEAATPSPTARRNRRIQTLSDDPDDDFEPEIDEGQGDRSPSKRKRGKIIHTLELDPVNKSLVGKTSKQMRRSLSPDGESWDETEHTTPTKKPVQKVRSPTRKDQRSTRPAPPIWRLQPPLEPYNPDKDLSPSPSPSSPVTPVRATAIESPSATFMESVQVNSDDFGFDSVSSTGSRSSAASPQSFIPVPIALGSEPETTNMNMPQCSYQRDEPSVKLDTDPPIADRVESALVEVSNNTRIIEYSEAEDKENPSVSSTAIEPEDMTESIMPTVEGSSEPMAIESPVGKMVMKRLADEDLEEANRDLQSVSKTSDDEKERGLNMISQKTNASKIEESLESRSSLQCQEETRNQDHDQEAKIEEKRRRGRPSRASRASRPTSSSPAASASSSPESQANSRRMRSLRRSPSVLISPSESGLAPNRKTLSASSETYLDIDGDKSSETATIAEHRSTMESVEPIEDCIEFMSTLRRVEEASDLLGKLNSRQLLEVQNRIIALNQAVCGVWGQRVNDLPGRKG
ncbi:DNA-binding protein rif1 [Linnemannia zychae]|nr:DNA-binding protein rif1 [Linnemannia zychae]